MYEPKDIDIGFVIIAPENNPKHVEITVSSISAKYGEKPFITVVTDSILEQTMDEMSVFGKVFCAKNTYSSLLSMGMKNAPAEWNIIVISGTPIRNHAHRKYSCFIESHKDILYPIIDRKMNFVDGSVNGIMIHRDAYTDLGDMPETPNLSECKAAWGSLAVSNGYKFKGIVGAALI
jgi:hypothetical protein